MKKSKIDDLEKNLKSISAKYQELKLNVCLNVSVDLCTYASVYLMYVCILVRILYISIIKSTMYICT